MFGCQLGFSTVSRVVVQRASRVATGTLHDCCAFIVQIANVVRSLLVIVQQSQLIREM